STVFSRAPSRIRQVHTNSMRAAQLIAVTTLLLGHVATAQRLSPPVTSRFKCLTNGCCDQHEWCRFWASIGECQSNAEWMAINCELACGTCPKPGASSTTGSFSTTSTTRAGGSSTGSSSSSSTGTTTASPMHFENVTSAFAGVKTVGSCADARAMKGHRSEVMTASRLVDAVEDTSGRSPLSLDDIVREVPRGCVPQASDSGLNCETHLCYHLMYRSLDGTCNNLKQPMHGASFRPYIRHFPSEYEDGKGEPVATISDARPPAREANRVMLSSAQSVVHDMYNNIMMQFGQFLSHDMVRTTLLPSAQCTTCQNVPGKCMSVPISDKDPNAAFKQRTCLRISRSAPICNIEPREQINENTAFIDGSMIYGSSPRDLHKFREGRTGLLKMTLFNQQMLLPFDQNKCASLDKCTATFTAGDIRANLFIGLSAMHIIFAREHNRLAGVLQGLNPSWSGDRVFQESRKIVGAQIQHVVYKSYLPKLLGSAFEKVIGPYKAYDSSVDPTVANEFTTGAFRFGHGMIEEFYQRIDFSGQNSSHGGFSFGDGVFKTGKILWEGGIDPIIRGMMITAVKRPHRMTPAITEKMFGTTDLGSLNIQRGRDHAIPSYNKMRVFCGLPAAKEFEDFKDLILDKNLRAGLAKNYKTVDDVDFYVGAMLEDPVVGGLVGTTLSCVIGEQFKRTRDGDRFYYENPDVFSAAQLAEINKQTLSRVICDNGDRFELVSEDAFLQPKAQLTPCTAIAEMDLTKWKE
ncbi:hypothetical protein PENTCL1PPCAC_4387, partial [Pristionchus entomophagus]